MSINKKNIAIISIIGLGVSLACSMVRNRTIKESTSEEKLHLFKVCLELAQDNLELQKKIEVLEKEA